MGINRIKILGGAGEIGGPNCTVLEVDGRSYVIDLGKKTVGDDEKKMLIRQELSECEMAAYLLTHAHFDHCGDIPMLAALGHDISKGYMSEPTRGFSQMQWLSALRYHQKKGNEPQFNEGNMFDTLSLSKIVTAGKEFEVGAAKIMPINVGHIIGALGYLVTIGKKRIFFTGDFSIEDTYYPLLHKFNLEEVRNNVDVLVVNATYAGGEEVNFEAERKRFVDTLFQMMKDGYMVILPAFMIDRAQKIYYFLRQHHLERYVYVDGGAREGFDMYEKYANQEFNKADQGHISTDPESYLFREVIKKRRPSIIIASSGMMSENTSSYNWAREFLDNEKAAIIFTGYLDQQLPGSLLLQAAKKEQTEIMWGGESKKIKARIEQFDGFSAHATSGEIKKLIEACNPSTTIFTHCNPQKTKKFLELHGNDLPGEKIIAKNFEPYDI